MTGQVPVPVSGLRTPDLRYAAVEEELRRAVRSLLASRSPLAAMTAHADGTGSADLPLWTALASDVGCAGLLVSEEMGGAGASYREAAVVAEETGWAVAPVPYLGSAVVATAVLLDLAPSMGSPVSDIRRQDSPISGSAGLLRQLASGERTAALTVDFAMAPGAALVTSVRVGPSRAEDEAGVTRLTGTVPGIADARDADVLLVPADGVPPGLYAVDAAHPGVHRAGVVSLDETRPLTDLTLDGVPARLLTSGPAAARSVAVGLQAGAAMLACELLGTGDRCLDLTVASVKERRQFGRPVGSFQAVKHRLADIWVALAQARAAARYAAACLADDGQDVPVAVALAKAVCGDTAVRAAQECVQLHGGIGFTWEHPAHLLLKRATSASLAFGSPDQHRAALATLADLPPPPG